MLFICFYLLVLTFKLNHSSRDLKSSNKGTINICKIRHDTIAVLVFKMLQWSMWVSICVAGEVETGSAGSVVAHHSDCSEKEAIAGSICSGFA